MDRQVERDPTAEQLLLRIEADDADGACSSLELRATPASVSSPGIQLKLWSKIIPKGQETNRTKGTRVGNQLGPFWNLFSVMF